MRSRAERQQDFESVKSDLFEAGVSVLKAAKAHDDMFSTSLEALAEAYESAPNLQLAEETGSDNSKLEFLRKIQKQRQQALDSQNYAAYVEAEEKLQHLDELEVLRVERIARKLEAHIRIQSANQQLATVRPNASSQWTTESLKLKYKTLKAVNAALSISAKSWKDATEKANKI